ncbi:unnamed protein product [Protopolystoma xenopodis]|uniref:Uncharacterized protein n=1 Tax=Protopolystoma xenopodis TaxID=117903 RepID=A0A3S5CMF6_9PLAT|nr:unnamed protein product [Protopolystoma xenopodis]
MRKDDRLLPGEWSRSGDDRGGKERLGGWRWSEKERQRAEGDRSNGGARSVVESGDGSRQNWLLVSDWPEEAPQLH